ncbi:MAG: hypothetical protein DYH12_27390, partial [Sorangiineae bacterium PRO1]|nr:hypothetical protein [Sorangiineae bacterium PRO1]
RREHQRRERAAAASRKAERRKAKKSARAERLKAEQEARRRAQEQARLKAEAERAEREAARPEPDPRPAPVRPKKAAPVKTSAPRAERRHDHTVEHTGPKLTPSPKKQKTAARAPAASKSATNPALILAIVTGVALVILVLAYWQKR